MSTVPPAAPLTPPATRRRCSASSRSGWASRASGEALAEHYGDRLPHGFGDPDRRIIAAYGDIDGSVVLSAADRPWFPTEDTFPVTDRPGIKLEQ